MMDSKDEYLCVCYVPSNMFERSKGETALVLMCLWSNPYINAVGVTPGAVQIVAKCSGLPEPQVNEAIQRLQELGECVFDRESGEVWIPQWLEMNYLQESTPAAKPEWVIEAVKFVNNSQIRTLLIKELERFDVQFDALARFYAP